MNEIRPLIKFWSLICTAKIDISITLQSILKRILTWLEQSTLETKTLHENKLRFAAILFISLCEKILSFFSFTEKAHQY